jgi:hypothetical protein
MADYVAETGCGEIVATVTPTAILNAIESLMRNYPARQRAATGGRPTGFLHRTDLAAFGRLYQQVSEKL